MRTKKAKHGRGVCNASVLWSLLTKRTRGQNWSLCVCLTQVRIRTKIGQLEIEVGPSWWRWTLKRGLLLIGWEITYRSCVPQRQYTTPYPTCTCCVSPRCKVKKVFSFAAVFWHFTYFANKRDIPKGSWEGDYKNLSNSFDCRAFEILDQAIDYELSI